MFAYLHIRRKRRRGEYTTIKYETRNATQAGLSWSLEGVAVGSHLVFVWKLTEIDPATLEVFEDTGRVYMGKFENIENLLEKVKRFESKGEFVRKPFHKTDLNRYDRRWIAIEVY